MPISEKVEAYAAAVRQQLLEKFGGELRINIASSGETLGKRIREGEMQKIPYLVIVGEKEEQAKTISVRARAKGDLGQMAIPAFSQKLTEEIGAHS